MFTHPFISAVVAWDLRRERRAEEEARCRLREGLRPEQPPRDGQDDLLPPLLWRSVPRTAPRSRLVDAYGLPLAQPVDWAREREELVAEILAYLRESRA